MSNQVYRNATPASPNVYVSDLVQGSTPAGGTLIPGTLSIGVVGAATESAGLDFLVRDPSDGLVHIRHAQTVPHTGFTLRYVSAGGQLIPSNTDTLALYGQAVVTDARVTYNGAGSFTLLDAGIYTATHTTVWSDGTSSGALLDIGLLAWFAVNSIGSVKLAASGTVVTDYDGYPASQSASFTFQASANDILQVVVRQDDADPHPIYGLDTAPNTSSIAITRVCPASSA